MTSFLLMVGDEGAVAVPPWRGRAVEALYAANDDPEPLLQALREKPRLPILILADTLAQEIRQEALPPLGPLDRRRLLARRLGQTFPSTSFRTALAARKDQALLACAHQDGPLGLWLARLAEGPNPSGAVALLPLESAAMIKALMPEAAQGWAMLLGWHRTGGFRQIVTRDGVPIFTRLTPSLPPDSSTACIVSALTLDLQASLGYLARHGLTDSDQLRLVALLPETLQETLAQMELNLAGLLTLTPHEAARRLELPFAPAPDDPACDLLHAAWALRRRPRALILPAARQKWREEVLMRWSKRGALIAGVLALGLLAAQSYGLFLDSRANRVLRQEVSALREQVGQERAALAPQTEPLGRLREALERQRYFTASAPTPWGLLTRLDVALGDKARVTGLEWRQDESLRIQLRMLDGPVPLEAVRQALPDYDVEAASPNETLTNRAEPEVRPELFLRKVRP